MAVMSFQALLFCPDEKTARVVTQVLSELEFSVEACNEPFAAVKKLMAQHYAAIVVDCDNEQNAALLFKSARNSATNTSCLFVAVVEGQTGVARAFRIGANLVLTKPINVEQSKSTLRVARGLLRKNEASKAPAPVPASPSVSPTQPLVPSSAPPVSGNSAFEFDPEPEPAPDPADAALLEYMPDSLASAGNQASQSTKQFPWQPAATLREPMASALRRAAEVAGHSAFDSHAPTSTGAAAAPAPAKQKPAPPLEFRTPALLPAGKRQEQIDETAVLPTSSPAATAQASTAAPTFFSLGRVAEEEDNGSGSAKKKLLVVALALLAAMGYFGWTRMQTSQPPVETHALPSANVPQPVEAPPAPPSPVAESPAPAPVDLQAEPNAPPAQKTEDLSLPPSSKPSAGKTSTVMTASPAPIKAAAGEKTQEPLIVKSDSRKPKSSGTPPVEAVEPPPVMAASSPDEKALSGIAIAPATVAAKPAQLTVKISQGISQGLLVKKVQPAYPASAKQLHLEGTVEVLATITKDGNVSSVKLLKGDSILGRAAIDAVRQWKYKPYYLNNDPVEAQTQVTVNFKLP
jgi:periplasmic protein TonB